MYNQLEYVYMVTFMILVGPILLGGLIAYRGEIIAYVKSKLN